MSAAARVFVFFLALGPLAACAKRGAPGVSEREVWLGITAPLSGPAATWGSASAGARAWAARMNAEGGIHGRALRVVIRDDAYTPGRALANVAEMKDSVFAIVGLLGSAVAHATHDLVMEAGLPLVFPTANPRVWAKRRREDVERVFVAYPDYENEGAFMAEQLVAQVATKRAAVFYQNDDFGKEGLAGLKRGALASGLSVIAEVPYEIQDREMSLQAVRLQQSRADAVVLFCTTTHGANVVREMARLGYRPALYASFTLADPQVMFRLLGELWDGAFFDAYLPLIGEPGADRVVEQVLEQDPSLRGREAGALMGAVQMMLVAEGLRRAGPFPTRENFTAALEGLHDWSPIAGLAPISFGPGRRHGLNALRLVRAGKAEDQSFRVVTGYRTFPPLF